MSIGKKQIIGTDDYLVIGIKQDIISHLVAKKQYALLVAILKKLIKKKGYMQK